MLIWFDLLALLSVLLCCTVGGACDLRVSLTYLHCSYVHITIKALNVIVIFLPVCVSRLTSSQLQGVLQYPISPCSPTAYTWRQSCSRDRTRKRSWRGGRSTRGKLKASFHLYFVDSLQLQTSGFHRLKANAVLYLAHHDTIVPHSRRVTPPHWLDPGRGQQASGGALLSVQGHTGEQVWCRAEQGEVERDSMSVQPAVWLQELQFGRSSRPAETQEVFQHIWKFLIHYKHSKSCPVSVSNI